MFFRRDFSSILRRDLIFSGIFSGSVLFASALYVTRNQIKNIESNTTSLSSMFSKTIEEIMLSLSNAERFKNWQSKRENEQLVNLRLQQINEIQFLPGSVKDFVKSAVVKWFSLSDGQKLIGALVCVNVAVFGMWKFLPSPLMNSWFTNSVYSSFSGYSSKSLTLLTSSFSHKDSLHLLMNMFAMASFGPYLADQMGIFNFVPFYVMSCFFSGLVSRYYRFNMFSYSLGASGSLLSVFSLLSQKNPDMKVSIVFLPGIEFTANQALCGMVAFDLLCLMSGRMIFDHAGHLGGVVFGIGYYYFNLEHNLWNYAKTIATELWKGILLK